MNRHLVRCRLVRVALPLVLAAGVALPLSVRAQSPDDAAPPEGSIQGRVLDDRSGEPILGVTVTLVAPGTTEAADPEAARITGSDGAFEFPSVRPGTYEIRFVKPGYRAHTMTEFRVAAGGLHRADLRLPRVAIPAATAGGDIEEFVVKGSPVETDPVELRVTSDELLNVMSAEELSRFAASDVAEGLKRVAGVSVVEGRFAIIRGLEDRYSSTLYNSAPIPSPDPDRQSVQLDLFPSDIVTNLVVAKTFAPDLPSNSSGGAIDILTHAYPDEEPVQVKLSLSSGFNSNARDRFLELVDGSPVGKEADASDVTEREFGISIAGAGEVGSRGVHYKGILNHDVDYGTAEGRQEGREPTSADFDRAGNVLSSGDLSLGRLGLSAGRFDLTQSEREEQNTAYFGFGFDLDPEGGHKIDSSFFYTRKQDEIVQFKENGWFPENDYANLARKQAEGEEISSIDFTSVTLDTWLRRIRSSTFGSPTRGPLWFTNLAESESYDRERDLQVLQLNGDHQFEAVEGFRLKWAANRAETSQDETAIGARLFFEPVDKLDVPETFPVTVGALGDGRFVATQSVFFTQNDIEEDQNFARLDGEYETPLSDWLTMKLSGGAWYELAERDVAADFLEDPTAGVSCGTTPSCQGIPSQFVILGDTPTETGEAILPSLGRGADGAFAGLNQTTNDSEREIWAQSFGVKLVLFEQVDLLGGLRHEKLSIESNNDPFIATPAFDGSPGIFPSKYVLFDRLDNPARGEIFAPPRPGTFFNDQILGIDVPADAATGFVDLTDRASLEALVNGKIDETRSLPSFGLAYRPIDGLTLRGAFSRTVARPSFREMGYYVTADPGTDDLVVGNPQLQLSDVDSYDARVEYTWGDLGELVAMSLFSKNIQDPIESIVVRNPIDFDDSSLALFRTFFNNPDDASVRGIELEARKNLGFLHAPLAEYFWLGGNYTYIDAEVDRTEAELARAQRYFGTTPGVSERFHGLETSRRLFNQPEWIANADLSFDHPDWGSKITLAFFAISDVLDAAGTASIARDGSVSAFTLDRYVDSYAQLDLIVSQTWRLRAGDLTLKLSAKNLTDSTRRIIYDTEQTASEVSERSFRVGRKFTFSIDYAW
jgi:TonB-dependent receptor